LDALHHGGAGQLEDAHSRNKKSEEQHSPERVALRNVSPRARYRSLEATTAQPFTTPSQSETTPDQMSQEEAEQEEHTPSKQDTDAAY